MLKSTDYPRGKFFDDDEGVLNIAMGMKDNTFILNFGKPVAWIGMSKEDAFNFARAIMRQVCDDVIDLEGSK